jgi:hypothetical protein
MNGNARKEKSESDADTLQNPKLVFVCTLCDVLRVLPGRLETAAS